MRGLEIILSGMWGPESVLKKKEIGLENALSNGWGQESSLKIKIDRARKHTIWYARAKKRTWKERDRARKHTI